jgi:hypothetical protein
MTALLALGLRTVPVVARGTDYVFGQSLRDVTSFLGLSDEGAGPLAPAELARRMDLVLAAASRFLRQIPDPNIGDKLPNRDRSYLQLGHHVFVIIDGFLDVVAGAKLTTEMLGLEPPARMTTGGDVAGFGATVLARLGDWTKTALPNEDIDRLVPTYYGDQPLHEVMERSTWHSAQHTRQLMMILDGLGLVPDGPLVAADLEGLPLPEKVWDD